MNTESTKIHRRPYSKPQLEVVRLIAEEAVLSACKAQGGGVGAPGNNGTCVTGQAHHNYCLAPGS